MCIWIKCLIFVPVYKWDSHLLANNVVLRFDKLIVDPSIFGHLLQLDWILGYPATTYKRSYTFIEFPFFLRWWLSNKIYRHPDTVTRIKLGLAVPGYKQLTKGVDLCQSVSPSVTFFYFIDYKTKFFVNHSEPVF